MPYELTYRDNGFFLVHTGVVTVDEINEANGKILGSSHFDEHQFQIIDLLQADFSQVVKISARLTGSVDAVASRNKRNVKLALVVVDPDALAFCEQYVDAAKRFESTWQFAIFPNMQAALEWVKAK